MIYTLTFNPAIDYIVHTDELKTGDIMRTQYENLFFGGKGINVSLILKELGVPSIATGFIAGFTGDAIKEGISCDLIQTDFVTLSKGLSRINIKIRAKEETDINGNGPEISQKDLKLLLKKLKSLQKGDFLVLAGSIPNSLPTTVYEQIMKRLKRKNISFVIDAEKDLLLNTLRYRPFLIKPNKEELEDLFSTTISTMEDTIKYARKLHEMGAENVLISLGAQGALLVDANGCEHKSEVLGGKPVNSVGAGDSMVAGFLAGFIEKQDYAYALKVGLAAGGATACSEGLANRSDILKLLESSNI